MGLLLLQADGKLALSDDIRKHIPELPDFGTPITLKHLLTHTGGYREVYNLLPMMGYGGQDAFSRDQVIAIVQRQPELQARPNTEFNYNNTGYILLATAIERVSGMTFPEYMRARVFAPLGMTHTRVEAEQGEVIPGSAQGYVSAEGGGYRLVHDLAASYGAGGIYTTVADLARWMLNYRDATLGGRGAIEAITTNTILEKGDSTGYGLGLGIGTFRGRRRYAHTGGDVAHRAYFGYYPELASGVIILSNNGAFDLGVGSEIALAFFGDRFEPEAEGDTAAAADMSEARMRAIAGDWRIVGPTASLDIVYTVDDGSLYAQATNQPRFRLTPTSDSTARFNGVEATVTFHFKADATVDSATHLQGRPVPMIRVVKVKLSASQLAEFAGGYYSEELDTGLEVALEGDSLVARNYRMEPFTLSHRDGLEFSGGFPFATITFQRAGNGRITGFMAANGRTKNVWFRAVRR
jgi:CubicO group peptidase (beta-lactamase class C family)